MASKRGKRMTLDEINERNYNKAVEKYRRDAGDLFELCSYKGMPEGWTNADELNMRLNSLRFSLEDKCCPPKPFDAASHRRLVTAIMLDGIVVYEGRTEDGKKTENLIGESHETVRRNAIVASLYDCCVHATILARNGSPCARQCFVEAVADLEMPDCETCGSSRTVSQQGAEDIVKRIERGLRLLWSEQHIREDVQRLSGNAKPDVELGAYARSIVKSCNFGTGELAFLNGMTYTIPPKSGKAREILEKLLRGSDPDGYVRLEKNWHSRFVRKDKCGRLDFDSHLTRLRYHVYDEPVAKGRRGTGRFRLEARIDTRAINSLRRQYVENERK